MFGKKAEEGGLYRVVGVPINDPAGFEAAIAKWNEPPYQTAGFLHEIILMNYGGIRLREAFLQSAYRLCRETGTPVASLTTCAMSSDVTTGRSTSSSAGSSATSSTLFATSSSSGSSTIVES